MNDKVIEAVYSGGKDKPKVGVLLKGQGWVELHGNFTLPELEFIVNQIKDNYQAKPNVDKK